MVRVLHSIEEPLELPYDLVLVLHSMEAPLEPYEGVMLPSLFESGEDLSTKIVCENMCFCSKDFIYGLTICRVEILRT